MIQKMLLTVKSWEVRHVKAWSTTCMCPGQSESNIPQNFVPIKISHNTVSGCHKSSSYKYHPIHSRQQICKFQKNNFSYIWDWHICTQTDQRHGWLAFKAATRWLGLSLILAFVRFACMYAHDLLQNSNQTLVCSAE